MRCSPLAWVVIIMLNLREVTNIRGWHSQSSAMLRHPYGRLHDSSFKSQTSYRSQTDIKPSIQMLVWSGKFQIVRYDGLKSGLRFLVQTGVRLIKMHKIEIGKLGIFPHGIKILIFFLFLRNRNYHFEPYS